MPDLPILHYPALFSDSFHYRGPTRLPGAYTIPDHWTVNSGTWTTSSEVQLECTAAGELIYNGTNLDDLRTVDTMSDYAFKMWIQGQEDLIFTLSIQRSDSSNKASVTIDFENNEIRLYRVAALVETINHTLAVNQYHLVEMWSFEATTTTRYIVLLNGSILIDDSFASLPDADGFALTVDQLPDSGTAVFHSLRIHELTDSITPDPITDPSDLVLQHRIGIKEDIENPASTTWASFKEAYKHYKFHKDFGRANDDWKHLGYPIHPPTTEQWFG